MKQSRPYPLFLDLSQRPVLVVGGGAVGLRKTRGLAQCGAKVTVVSPAFIAGFQKMSGIRRIRKPYATHQLKQEKWRLVFAATDSMEVNAQVAADAGKSGILCCRADKPEEGDFSGGATRYADGVLFAVSTRGASPVLARRICEQAAENMDATLPKLAALLATWRAELKEKIADISVRRKLLHKLSGEEMESVLRSQGAAGARRLYKKWMRESDAH